MKKKIRKQSLIFMKKFMMGDLQMNFGIGDLTNLENLLDI
jgi:hypothetical protein